jgi:hypothetical protein
MKNRHSFEIDIEAAALSKSRPAISPVSRDARPRQARIA